MHAAPGWYPDPRGGDGYRYWTGDGWAPDPGPAFPPLPTTPHATRVTAASSPWQRPDPDASRFAYAGPPAFDQLGASTGLPAADVPAWRRAATWAALAAGLALGFGAGFVVADAREDQGTTRAVASASPSPTASGPTASASPSEEAEETDELKPSSGPSPRGPADKDASLLHRLGLRPTDVAPGVAIDLIPDGDKVIGTTTLDLCEARYNTEFRRTARRQLVAVAGTEVILSTEAVLYRDAAATEAAFAELRANSAQCDAQTGLDADWPEVEGVERLVYQVFSHGPAGAHLESTIVYMRRGRTLLALYFRHPGVETNPVAGHNTIPGAVGVYAKRLAAMPAAAGSAT